jgi:signal transduction histidine kinase/ligand-binding sensor domain-containing protein/DNA-binding response OmpR family regulator
MQRFGFLFVIMAFTVLSRTVVAQSLFFSTLTTRDGLPSNVINSIAQDHDQFIWIGTANGLVRYDGYRFETFHRQEAENSLPANEISSLLVDGQSLWVGTWRGLCKIDTRTFQVTRINLKDNSVIRTLYKDRNNTIWIGTANGLVRFTPTNQQFKIFNAENSGLSHNTIRTIYEDKAGNLWVGTYDKLNLLGPGQEKFETINLKGDYKPALKNNLICDIKPVSTSDSLLWIGTETGLCLFNINTHRYQHYTGNQVKFSNEVIKHIYAGPDGNLWLGTDFGLNIFNPHTKTTVSYFHNPQVSYSIANNVIWQIFEDAGGVVWLVTANGISRANKQNHLFSYHEVTHRLDNQIIGDQVKSILISRKGMLWVASLHGVIRINPQDGTQKVFTIESPAAEQLLLNNVYALEEDDQDRVWIGTAGGINVWDDRKGQMHAITANAHNGLTSNYIARFIKSADGTLWVSAWEGGLFKVIAGQNDLQSIRFEFVGDFASEKNTYAMNAIWGIRNNALYRINLDNYTTQKIESFQAAARGRDIYSLYYAPQGSLWAGTVNGLIEYKPSLDSAIFHPIVTGNDVDINNIIGDDFGNVWAAADKFILKFSPAHQTSEIFPLDKNLPLKTFYPNCAAMTNTGDILFGGDNGYIQFRSGIRPSNYKPHVFITSLEINNKPIVPFQEINDRVLLTEDIAFTKELVLDYGQHSFTVNFSALHFWQTDINVYAYRLEGFDDQWHYVSGAKNFAVYSNLSPGQYTFQVKGTNNYGIWSDSEASMNIVIKPPLFLSPFFIALYVVLALATITISLRVYVVRLKLTNDVRIARLEKTHAEEIVQSKQQFFTSISHELRTPLSLMIPPMQQVLKRKTLDEESRNLISIAEKNSQRLLRLINQILDFRKLEHENQSLRISWFDLVPFCQELSTLFSDKAARNEINFIFSASPKECPIWADKEKVEIIIFNLLSNAFKFTPKKGRIELSLTVDSSAEFPQGAARIAVSDSGIGIAQEEQTRIFEQFYQTGDARKVEDGSGIGLTLVAEYTKLHRGEIRLESAKGNGSSFHIFLPLGNMHFPVDQSLRNQEINLVATRHDHTGEQYEFNLPSAKPLILLVEDNLDMIDFVLLSLQDKYSFITADNGEDGLQKAFSLLPEIIISDIMMPVMDGLELCRRIKQDTRTSHIPLILLTAKGLTTQKIEGIRMGADIYLTKPFELELLEAHIDHLLERKAELAEYFKHELITQPVSDSLRENEDDRFLKKVMSTIEANISNSEFGVEMLSEEMGISTAHLYRKLKSLTHLSANEIIKKYRIKKASLLLKNKEGNITEIMYEVGFTNLSYFSKCFKNEFTLTPKEYQQRESKHSFNVNQSLE